MLIASGLAFAPTPRAWAETAGPSNTVEEIVAGGASAVYGSDAVAGVINIITKKRYDGFEAQARTLVSEYGNGRQHELTLTADFYAAMAAKIEGPLFPSGKNGLGPFASGNYGFRRHTFNTTRLTP